MQTPTRREGNASRVHSAKRGETLGPVQATLRIMSPAAAIAIAVAVSACVPGNVVQNQVSDPKSGPLRSAARAAEETALLEPGRLPHPAPEIPIPVTPSDASVPRLGHVDRMVQEVHDGAPLNTPDVWARMRRQFTISRPHSSRIRHQADWFRRNHDYFDRVAERSRDFLPYIVREAERRGLPLELALLPVIESAFQPFAYSPARASGLWQFIPSTARLYGLRMNWWYDGRRDLVAATSAAFDYLEKLHRDFDGDWLLAVAAYNWGEGNIRRALARNRKHGKPLDFWSLKVPKETRTYVPRWLAVCDIVARPEHYGMDLQRVPDEVGFRLVEVDHQIDLALAADLAEISLDRLYRLNAGYRRWATEPQGPHQLLIPVSNADAFVHRVASLPPRQQVTWRHHVVMAGDTLSGIAETYRTSVDALARHNRLNDTLIKVGEQLLIPKRPGELETESFVAEVSGELSPVQRGNESTRARRHRVKKGDSLWLIARRHGIALADLVARNRLDPEVWLMPGQILELRETLRPATPVATSSEKRGGERYVVRNGDNLWLIARRHGVSVDNLVAWNQLDRDVWLMPGQILALRASSAPVPAAPIARRDGRYTVRDGDNLWLIARRHGASVADIRNWNELDADDWLMPGQVLSVHRAQGLTPSDSTILAEGRGGKRHIVRNGENLWVIARRYGVSVHELRAWNGLDPDDWLMPGDVLEVQRSSIRIPSSVSRMGGNGHYVVRNGDSLWVIARRHSISASQLASWNEITIDGVLRPGQTLKIAPPSGAHGKAATDSL